MQVGPSANTKTQQKREVNVPAPCWDFTKRVARSIHTIKQPVTLGSRVPECPVLLTFKILRNQATTSCEEGFEGLSRFITPELHEGEPRVVQHERGSTLEERAGKGRQSVSPNISLDISLQRATTLRYWSKMCSPSDQPIVVFE